MSKKDSEELENKEDPSEQDSEKETSEEEEELEEELITDNASLEEELEPIDEEIDESFEDSENVEESFEIEGSEIETTEISDAEEMHGEETEIAEEDLLEEDIAAEDLEQYEESDEEKAARIEREVRDFHKNQIEAALYAGGKPISVEELSTKLEIKKREVEELVNELAFDYLDRSTSLVIAQIGDRYQMQIKPEYTEKVSKFAQGGAIAEKYLRTLTIIALKQPLLKSTVIKLRGTGAYEHIKYLQENGLISAVKKGRSEELTTTDQYAEMFGLPRDREQMKRTMIAQLGVEPEGE